jgi:hypothetical protein
VVSATTDLLREERVDAGEAHDLRQLRGVAKRVFLCARDCRRSESWAMNEDGKRREERGVSRTGQPELGTVGAEFAFEVLLTEEELTDQRFLFPYQHHTNALAQRPQRVQRQRRTPPGMLQSWTPPPQESEGMSVIRSFLLKR